MLLEIEVAMLDVTGCRNGEGASTTGLGIYDIRGMPGRALIRG